MHTAHVAKQVNYEVVHERPNPYRRAQGKAMDVDNDKAPSTQGRGEVLRFKQCEKIGVILKRRVLLLRLRFSISHRISPTEDVSDQR